MKRILINPGKWMLNLSNVPIHKSSNNSYFSDSFFGTFTYPFDIYIDSELENFIFHYNQSEYKKVFDKLILNENGNIEECRLIILSYEGKKMSAQLVLGFDNFPNFEKKLNELPLYNSNLNESIVIHAENYVGKTYPEVNYTFPAIHTEMDSSNNLFSYFKGTYNLRENGKFIENTIDGTEIKNYSLIEPAISLLYLLKIGITTPGFTLKGNILENELIKSTYIFSPYNYSAEKYPDKVNWLILRYEYSEILEDETFFSLYSYTIEQEILYHGKFRVTGSIDFDGDSFVESGDFKFIYNGEILAHLKGEKKHISFDFTFINNPNTGAYLTLSGLLITGDLNRNLMACSIIPLEIYDKEGNIYNPNFNNNKIDLRKHVPDMTFGEFVKILKNLYNLDIYRSEKDIYINFIENEIINFSDALDYSSFEVKEPLITFNEDKSFHLKYNYEGQDYSFTSLYVDKSGSKSKEFSKLENTIEISCDAIPLPKSIKNNINTSRTLSEDKKALQLVIYKGLKAGKNETLDNAPYLWSELYSSFWQEWLEFRIDSDTFKWKFKTEKNINLSIKDKIYAYGRYHIINKLNIQDLTINGVEIELETNSE